MSTKLNTKFLSPWLAILIVFGVTHAAQCTPLKGTTLKGTTFKGWDYLAAKLIHDGVKASEVKKVFNDRRMPHRPFVPFGLKPAEPKDIYTGFLNPQRMTKATKFLRQHQSTFTTAEHKYKVDRHIINAILYVETQFGAFTGNNTILIRIARGASVGEPSNVRQNYQRLVKEGEKTSLKAVQERSVKVEAVFYPELKALFTLAKNLSIDIFNIKGSSAGAFGLPQFMPSSYLRFAVDGNRDGRTSLYQIPDAIFSVGNYFAHFGWRNSASKTEKKDVIWMYNKSHPYCETILKVAEYTRSQLAR